MRTEWDQRDYQHQELTAAIIQAAISVHRALGPGFLEVIYENAMVIELQAMGLSVQRQVYFPVLYRGHEVGKHFADLVVEGKVLVELKHVEEMIRLFSAQVRSTLRAADLEVGLLINFNVPRLKDGITRIVETRTTPMSSSALSAPLRPESSCGYE